MELSNFNKDKKVRRKPVMDMGNMVFGKVPPQSKELEEAVLAFESLVEKEPCIFIINTEFESPCPFNVSPKVSVEALEIEYTPGTSTCPLPSDGAGKKVAIVVFN